MTAERYEDWTVCEEHGHHFEDGFCTDCGEPETPGPGWLDNVSAERAAEDFQPWQADDLAGGAR